PLRDIEAESRARLADMQPLSAAVRQQTPSSAYAQCYIKIASMRIGSSAQTLASWVMGEEQLLASIRKASFSLLPSFDPARLAKVDASTELKERVKAQYIERMTGAIL
ncbi:hypothetical protein V8E36_001440, partial [Tilletia maclaganii]